MKALTVRNLKKSFGSVHAVRGVSFDVEKGQIAALIGPNGAGKSTCFNTISGQIRRDSGEVKLYGLDISAKSPPYIWAHGVGRTFQTGTVFESMSVRENIQIALQSRHKIRMLDLGKLSQRRRTEADQLLERVGLTSQADRAASVLAYGDVKRLELAMALSNEPKLLLMDEPTAGMAPKERIGLIELVASLVRETELSVLFTEHSLDVVFGYANVVMVMAEGELISTGTPESVRDDPVVQKAYLGSGKFLQTSEMSS